MPSFLERLRGDPARVRLERLERLQGLTEELSAAQTREEVLRVIFERGLALVDASAVMLYVERAPGELELVHGLGVSDEFVQRQRRVLSEDPLPIAEAYRTGTPVWLASREEIGARFPRLEPGADRVRALAWAAIPLASGAVRGALGLQFPERRAFDEEERNFVLAVARQCSLAVERARLFDASSRLAERLRQLLSTTSALSSATTVRDVAAAAFRALGALGACAAEIHGIEEGGERVALLARHGRAAAVRGVAVAVDAPTPAAEVVRTGKAIWLESAEQIAQRFPHLEQDRAAKEEAAWAVVPLLASGRSLGALVAIFAEPRRLESDDRTFVRLVAQPCAQALERARLFEEAARSRVEAEWDSALVAGMCGAAPVGLALLDREMRFVKVNENFARVDGVALAAHVGRTPLEILPQAPADEIVSAFRSALDSGQALEQPMEGAAPSEPGVRRRFATSWFPVRVRGEIAGVGVLLRELR
ncbi:MAG TPA: GAF domain-containing protein [Anaeromyxobacter sp.]